MASSSAFVVLFPSRSTKHRGCLPSPEKVGLKKKKFFREFLFLAADGWLTLLLLGSQPKMVKVFLPPRVSDMFIWSIRLRKAKLVILVKSCATIP